MRNLDEDKFEELDRVLEKEFNPPKEKLVQKDGSPVPERADVLHVGERVQVKRGWYKVIDIKRRKLVLRPVKPTEREKQLEAEIAKLVTQVKSDG